MSLIPLTRFGVEAEKEKEEMHERRRKRDWGRGREGVNFLIIISCGLSRPQMVLFSLLSENRESAKVSHSIDLSDVK